MANQCAREQLNEKFSQWLNEKYSGQALELVDLQSAAKEWVAEEGKFVGGVGLCVFATCELCGQRPKVLEDGNISMLQGEPFCTVAPQPAIVPVFEFNA